MLDFANFQIEKNKIAKNKNIIELNCIIKGIKQLAMLSILQ